MTANLVIVESPAKAKTIEKYLGKDFQVLASYGHVEHLVPKDGAVDTEGDYALRYQVIPGREKQLKLITAALKDSNTLYLATDPDREGEAISWSLCNLLKAGKKLTNKKVHRIIFHEITREAIQNALKNPRELSATLVNARQARLAIDYLVGFNLSPLLWRKIAPKLSAGRVQSPSLRLIVEREEEIDRFDPVEYWTVDAMLKKGAKAFTAKLHEQNGKKLKKYDLGNEKQAFAARDQIREADELAVAAVTRKERKRNPAAPFTTSTLQQDASRKLYFSAKKIMQTAQKLYEGVDLGSGEVGLITYMRTDSVILADEALANLRQAIEKEYGKDQMLAEPRHYKTKTRNAQEAHEAIRPTNALITPAQTRGKLTTDQQKLYELIWKRTMACQMIPAILDQVSVDIKPAGSVDDDTAPVLRATGSHVRVPGFMQVYRADIAKDDNQAAEEDERFLPDLEKGDKIDLKEIEAKQHFTDPPPRYSEASLVKALEEHGIGRPSTYAETLSTLTTRNYTTLESRVFRPTAIGKAVCKFLTEHFTRYVDYEFTAKLEDELDQVARGETEWTPVVDTFWQPFHKLVEEKGRTVSRQEAQRMRELGIDPKSGRPVRTRIGRFGPFVQIGDAEDEEKPKFAALREGQDSETITFEEAMELFKLPRQLGVGDNDEPIESNVGRYGPYIKYGEKKYVSLAEDDDPMTVTLERAQELIAEHKIQEAKKVVHDFEGEGIRVLNGRYGPYMTDGKKNVKVPKDIEPADLTLEQCRKYIEEAPVRKGRGRQWTKKKKK